MMLTAIHLLGPLGGLPEDVAARSIPAVVTNVTLVECFDDDVQVEIGCDLLPIFDAAPFKTPSGAGDVVAFWVPPGSGVVSQPLADSLPEDGAQVWLAAQLLAGAPPERRLHRGTAMGIDNQGHFVYRFENPSVSIQATSGAPVLNAAGEVVAVNTGGFELDGDTYGFANPVERFRKFLESAARSEQ
jgi:hypothetical protein